MFSTAKQLYCGKKCGASSLDKRKGCQVSDADVYCKLKYCDEAAYSQTFAITKASENPGISCAKTGRNYGTWMGIENIFFDKSHMPKCKKTLKRGHSCIA